jgi:ABC-type lipoprotein export system ATPase subunit
MTIPARFTLENVTKSFLQADSTISVLKDISITFEQEMSYAITGPSGTGKSTLIHLLAGIDKPTSGKIFYNEQDIACFTQQEQEFFLQHTIGLIYQYPYLLKELTVLENVMLKGLITGQTPKICNEKALELLSRVKLVDKADLSPAFLSGGEQQRVSIARALFIEPKFLLADEPTAHLDEQNKEQILTILRDLQKETGAGLIISSHDTRVAQACNRQLTIQNQRLVSYTTNLA